MECRVILDVDSNALQSGGNDGARDNFRGNANRLSRLKWFLTLMVFVLVILC